MSGEFEARRFLTENFHDAPGVVAYLRGKGEANPPSEAAVVKWFTRNSLPGDWLAKLAGYLEGDRNGAGQIAKFVQGE